MPTGAITVNQEVHRKFLVENAVIKDSRPASEIDPKEVILQRVTFNEKGGLEDVTYPELQSR